jgi:hypothetical protein
MEDGGIQKFGIAQSDCCSIATRIVKLNGNPLWRVIFFDNLRAYYAAEPSLQAVGQERRVWRFCAATGGVLSGLCGIFGECFHVLR